MKIVVQGARTHNLQGICVEIPQHRMTVFTGVSGSGKSSLAFDTIFAEGQRRYLESLPSHTRGLLDRLERPAVDFVDGLSPAVSIGQFASPCGARSTLATLAELQDYLRLLFAHLGTAHCPVCGREVHAISPGALTEELLRLPEGTRVTVLSPLLRPPPRGNAAFTADLSLCCDPEKSAQKLARARLDGFLRVWIDGALYAIEDLTPEQAENAKEMDLVVDRLVVREGVRTRMADSIEQAMRRSGGEIRLLLREPGAAQDSVRNESERFSCADCRLAFAPLVPASFSFNSHAGACPHCSGLGTQEDGSPCPHCHGERLRPESLASRIELPGLPPRNIAELLALSVHDLRRWKNAAETALSETQKKIALPLLEGLEERLAFLEEAGLGYLQANRPSATLSGGELRRVRLASALGQHLSGVLYVLDEPTAGLHPRDVEPLVSLLLRLRDAGNTVLVVEHNPAVIRAADHIIELGPGAGANGGKITFEGSFAELLASPVAVTAPFLQNSRFAQNHSSATRTNLTKETEFLFISGACAHNLKHIDVRFPLGAMSVITGVSGSGKTTLAEEVAGKNLQQLCAPGNHAASHIWMNCTELRNFESVEKIISVGQAVRTRSPRSNILTFTGLFRPIRELYAATPMAKARGYTPSRFLFTAKGGRCEACKGEGVVRFEMSFLPDVEIPCEDCGGKRFNRETLDVHWSGRSIADMLALRITEANELFSAIPNLKRQFALLEELGLGYLTLGQSVSTLSGGEAQRLLLASELARPSRAHTLYLLDEPSCGQHPADILLLLKVLERLRAQGHTIIAVDHNPMLMRAADWIVDLGPGGGENGGRVLFEGPPEQLRTSPDSFTADFL